MSTNKKTLWRIPPNENLSKSVELCHTSWKRISGSPASESSFFNCRYALPGWVGFSGLRRSGKIHWLTAWFFRSLSRWTALGGRRMVRRPRSVLVSPISSTPALGAFTERTIFSVPARSSKSCHMSPQISPRRRPVVSSV